MPRLSGNRGWLADDMARWQCARELQRKLFDGGFAGLCFPAEYGGWGLSLAHQHVLDEETDEYEMPILFNVPTIGIIGATLLDFGT